MILNDFLSRQKHNDRNPHKLISILFNIHNVLHDIYYNIGILGKYMVQMWSQTESSGIKLPEVHGVAKGLDPHAQPKKQTTRPIVSKAKEI